MQAKLPRHLKLVHKDEPEVIKAVSLPSKQSNQAFERLKKLGIYKYNKEMVKQGQTSFIRERQQGDCHDLQMCCYCKGFFAKKYIYRHISTCSSKGEEAEGGVPIVPVNLLAEEVDCNFRDTILAKFRQDEVGLLYRNDPLIVTVGQYQFKKLNRKKDKKTEVKKSTMSDMRRLGNLFLAFQNSANKNGLSVRSDDMLDRQFFPYLEEAIESSTSTNEDEIPQQIWPTGDHL